MGYWWMYIYLTLSKAKKAPQNWKLKRLHWKMHHGINDRLKLYHACFWVRYYGFTIDWNCTMPVFELGIMASYLYNLCRWWRTFRPVFWTSFWRHSPKKAPQPPSKPPQAKTPWTRPSTSHSTLPQPQTLPSTLAQRQPKRCPPAPRRGGERRQCRKRNWHGCSHTADRPLCPHYPVWFPRQLQLLSSLPLLGESDHQGCSESQQQLFLEQVEQLSPEKVNGFPLQKWALVFLRESE